MAGKLESANICNVIVANSASANPSIVNDPLDPLAFGAKKIVVVLSKLAWLISSPSNALNSSSVKSEPPTLTRTILSLSASKPVILISKLPSLLIEGCFHQLQIHI